MRYGSRPGPRQRSRLAASAFPCGVAVVLAVLGALPAAPTPAAARVRPGLPRPGWAWASRAGQPTASTAADPASSCRCSTGRGPPSPPSARTSSAPTDTARCRYRRRRRPSCWPRTATRGGRPISPSATTSTRGSAPQAQLASMITDLPCRRGQGIRRRRAQPHDRPGQRRGRRRRHDVPGHVRLPAAVLGGRLPQLPHVDHQLGRRVPGVELRACLAWPTWTPDRRTCGVRRRPTSTRLIALGVDGLRWDSAKEMAPADIAAIEALLTKQVFVYQDVQYGAGQPVTPDLYEGTGSLLEFRYGWDLFNAFTSGTLASLSDFGPSWNSAGMVPSGDAVVFVDDQDTRAGRRRARPTPAAPRTRWPTCSCWPGTTAPRRSCPTTPTPVTTRGRPAPGATPSPTPTCGTRHLGVRGALASHLGHGRLA